MQLLPTNMSRGIAVLFYCAESGLLSSKTVVSHIGLVILRASSVQSVNDADERSLGFDAEAQFSNVALDVSHGVIAAQ